MILQFAWSIAREFENDSASEVDRPGPSVAEPGDGVSLISDGDMEIAGADFRGDLLPELVQRRMRLAEMMAETEAVEAIGEHLPPEQLAEHLQNLRSDFDPGTIEDAEGRSSTEEMEGDAPQNATTRPANAEALARLIRAELDASRNRAQREEAVLRRAFGETGIVTRSYFYDEWDYVGKQYTKGWCRLYEQRLQGDDYDYFRVVRQRHRLLAAGIENQLRRIRAESLARVKRVADGDELDLDQLLAAVVDRRAGLMPDDRVYSRKERTKREVAAAFLLDMSASTDDEVPDPETETVDLQADASTNTLTHDWSRTTSKRRVIDVEKDALVLMSEALTVLGDAFAIYGFSGYGHDEVEFYVAKEFDEGLNARTKSALAAMKPKRSTRMGPAIRHAIRRLQAQDAPLKVLIMLSDGFPQDSDYGPDRNDHEYGIQDTAKAIQEAEQRNIATFCITVDQSGHDYLRRMCEEDRYLVIDEIESLPNELSKIYQLLTV
jgi:nitric oxide reductase activation protein